MSFIRANFSEVYNARYGIDKVALSAESISEPSNVSFFDGTGYHLYSELSLLQRMTAPQNATDAAKAFEIIQRYTDIAEVCAQKAGGRILEVQGERLHLFFENVLSKETLAEIIVFCTAFTKAVYQQKKYLGDDNFNGFKICFDHGRAVIMSTGHTASDSFVSLGPCANRPAKRLVQVSAKNTCMPTEVAKFLFPVDNREGWHSINLFDRDTIPLSASDMTRYDDIVMEAEQVMTRVYDSSQFFVRASRATNDGQFSFSSADLQQGFFMRADLDGFTKKVQAAFDSGSEQEILSLLTDFACVLKYGDQFITRTRRPVIRLPWAGDCANIFLLPKTTEDIDDAQLYYPAKGQADWLSGYKGEIKPPFEDAKWLVSMCCGDESCGNRNVLIAQVKTSERSFMFATGWSVGRSQDAHEIDGLRAGDALTSKVDYDALESEYQEYFYPASSIFVRSGSLLKLVEDGETHVPSLTAQARSIPGIAMPTPQPRPYWCEKH